MKVKSKEVAEALGVSTATVSLAINGKPGVNEETRKRILEYISGQQGKDVTKGTFVKLIIFENSPRVLSGGMGSFSGSLMWRAWSVSRRIDWKSGLSMRTATRS